MTLNHHLTYTSQIDHNFRTVFLYPRKVRNLKLDLEEKNAVYKMNTNSCHCWISSWIEIFSRMGGFIVFRVEYARNPGIPISAYLRHVQNLNEIRMQWPNSDAVMFTFTNSIVWTLPYLTLWSRKCQWHIRTSEKAELVASLHNLAKETILLSLMEWFLFTGDPT